MSYLLAKIFVCLCVAALIGGVVGWLLRRFKAMERETELNSELDVRAQRLGSLERVAGEQESQIAEVTADRDVWQAKVPVMQATIDERDEQVMGLTMDLDGWKKEVPTLQTALAAARADMQQARTALDSAEAERGKLTQEITGMRADLESQQAQHTAGQAAFDRLQSEAAGQEQRMRHLDASIGSLNRDLRARDVALNTLQQEIERVSIRAAGAPLALVGGAAVQPQVQRLKALEAGNATQWRSRVRMAESARVAAERENQRLTDRIRRLESDVRATQARADAARVARLVGSDPAEADANANANANANEAKAVTATGTAAAQAAVGPGAIAAAVRSAAIAMETAAGQPGKPAGRNSAVSANASVYEDTSATDVATLAAPAKLAAVAAPASAATMPALAAGAELGSPGKAELQRLRAASNATDKQWRSRLRIAESARQQMQSDSRRKDERIAQLEEQVRGILRNERKAEIDNAYDPGFYSEPPAVVDDLTAINGVGGVLSDTLNEMGIYQYEQLANLTPEDIAWVDSRLKFKGRLERDDWVGQARDLYEAKYGQAPQESS